MSVTISDVKIPLRGRLVEGAISIQDGRISKIGKTALAPETETRIDGRGLIASPGLIDVHVHLRDMQLAYKEDFSTGTLAAAAGGFTTVLDMPNTKPPTNSVERLREKIDKARSMIHVNVGFYASLPESQAEQREMKNAGAIAFKLYMNDSSPDTWHRDHTRLLASLKASASLDVPVACHAESGSHIARLQARYQEAGKNSFRDFLRAHAPRYEVEAVRTITRLAVSARSRIHVCHLSTERALRGIIAARRARVKVTCETAPHHLLLDQRVLARKKGLALTGPPLRNARDANSLWKSLIKSQIDVVASDHAPHTLEEKTKENVWRVKPGVPGLETTLPLLLTKLSRNEITLGRIIDVLASGPARIFGLQRKGQLAAGMDADLVLIDPKQHFRIDSSKFHSKARFSPFDDVECIGQPVLTMVAGHVVYDHGEIIEMRQGKILTHEAGS